MNRTLSISELITSNDDNDLRLVADLFLTGELEGEDEERFLQRLAEPNVAERLSDAVWLQVCVGGTTPLRSAESEPAESELAQPKLAQPKLAQPKLAQPKLAQPKLAQPVLRNSAWENPQYANWRVISGLALALVVLVSAWGSWSRPAKEIVKESVVEPAVDSQLVAEIWATRLARSDEAGTESISASESNAVSGQVPRVENEPFELARASSELEPPNWLLAATTLVAGGSVNEFADEQELLP
jgi:hypothetical protein